MASRSRIQTWPEVGRIRVKPGVCDGQVSVGLGWSSERAASPAKEILPRVSRRSSISHNYFGRCWRLFQGPWSKGRTKLLPSCKGADHNSIRSGADLAGT